MPTVAGWLYLAVVLDVFSRRVIGWTMDTHRRTRVSRIRRYAVLQ